jgi:hypothetical protein
MKALTKEKAVDLQSIVRILALVMMVGGNLRDSIKNMTLYAGMK